VEQQGGVAESMIEPWTLDL